MIPNLHWGLLNLSVIFCLLLLLFMIYGRCFDMKIDLLIINHSPFHCKKKLKDLILYGIRKLNEQYLSKRLLPVKESDF